MAGILFDARWVRRGMTGVGYFAFNLLKAFGHARKDCGLILTEGCPYAGELEGFRIHFTRVDLVHHPLTDLYEQAAIPFLCWRHGYRSFVSFEGRTPAFHPGIRTYPFVYDLSYLKLRSTHNLRYTLLLRANLLISRLFATRIATISETVRGEIVGALGVARERTLVIYPAGTRLSGHAEIAVPSPSKPYFLAVGITNPRKNLGALLEAFSMIRKEPGGDAIRLAVTGNPSLIKEALRERPVEGVENLGFVKEGELRHLYCHALGLVYPSLDEGFGIPLVDASEFGCPVLCSDIPVFREVMQGDAAYFDPASPASLAEAMRKAIARGRDGSSCAAAGRFSWERSAALLEDAALS